MRRRELIGMHDPETVDAGDGDAGAVAAVVAHQRKRFIGTLRIAVEQPVIDEGRVGVIVDRHHLYFAAGGVPRLDLIEQLVHQYAFLRRLEIDAGEIRAAAGVDEVVEAQAADALVLADAENAVDFVEVVLRDGEADADADAGIAAVADAADGVAERAGAGAPAGGALLVAVDADADVGHADVGDAPRLLRRDQRSVRGERDAHAE